MLINPQEQIFAYRKSNHNLYLQIHILGTGLIGEATNHQLGTHGESGQDRKYKKRANMG